jgi:hypothetical protein
VSPAALDQPVVCADERERRGALLGHPTLNGIDFLEVDATDLALIHVHFLNDLPPNAYKLPTELERISIEGGTRIVGVRVISAVRISEEVLDVRVDRVGDFSPYVLELSADELDPRFSRIAFSFRAGCAVDVAPTAGDDARAPGPAPALDYLAKDYASFRRLMLDLLPQLNPRFTERNPADIGIALVELLAYAGDRLSYFQDAVANEAYLETARQRVSVRRLARLVDYRMHDGANASTVLHVQVAAGTSASPAPTLPAGTRVVTRVTAPLRTEPRPPRAAIAPLRISADALETDPALASAVVFETARDLECFEVNNEIFMHAWGNEECCLPEGATEAWLYSSPSGTNVVRPRLAAGDLLVLEEARGPETGLPADANPLRRKVVELTHAADGTDELFSATLLDGELQLRDGDPPLPLLHVAWRREDALPFPLCLSRRDPDLGLMRNLSLARGNAVAADHGLTATETHALPAPADGRLRLRLERGPLTVVDSVGPEVELEVLFEGGDTERWVPVPDLLDSPPFAQDFVVELGDDGRSVLRFGDGVYGRSIAGATSIRATYRIGNGRAGNVGAAALAHVSPRTAIDMSWVVGVRNPLPAVGGTDPEPIEQVRARAPQAFRAKQLRAVTVDDWAQAARESPDVQGAFAHFRWTGSWYTAVVAVDPRSPADLVTGPDGRIRLHPDLATRIRGLLERYRLAGYDLELLAPTFVPIELELEVCAAPGHFRSDVAAAVAEALSTRTLRGGRRGFFHPENFTFGQPVHLSRIYAAVEEVEGVDSAVVRVFQRFGREQAGELGSGVLPIEPGEIAQLENDPNFLEHGVLRIVAMGGKA